MLFSVLAAVLTALCAACLIFPLLRREAAGPALGAGEAEVYRDQLLELDRDLKSGLIEAEDAAYARAEIGRRLIGAAAEAQTVPASLALNQAAGTPSAEMRAASRRRRLAEIATILFLPLTGLLLYGATGRPDLPDRPLAARLAEPGNDLEILVAKAERHLAANPDDARGWDVLAPIYLSTNRLEDAERAYRNAMRIAGANPARLSGLADVLMAASGGAVTEEARTVLEQGAAADPANPRFAFYLALGLEQSGRKAEAEAAFARLAASAPADAPWLPLVRSHLGAGVAAAPPQQQPGPDAAAMADAAAMTPAARAQMIEGMVASLDARLAANPRDIEGWLRLIRSQTVLGRRDKAQEALGRGLAAFPPPSSESARLTGLARELGLSGQEKTP